MYTQHQYKHIEDGEKPEEKPLRMESVQSKHSMRKL